MAVPEHFAPGESQSNGRAERSIQMLVDHIRTCKLAWEARCGGRIPSAHPILAWLVEHCAFFLNRYATDQNGLTPFAKLHGKDSRDRVAELEEQILWFVPKKKRVKLDARWRYGVFLGRSMNTDYNYVGLSDGTVVCARAMVKVIPSKRWDVKRLMGLRGTPNHEKTKNYEGIEEDMDPHAHPDESAESSGADLNPSEPKRLKITLKDLKEHGYSDGCPKCSLHKRAEHRRARYHNHTETCRARVYEALRIVGSEKITLAESGDKGRTGSR